MTQEKAVVIRAPVEVTSFEELQKQTQRLNEFYKSLMQKGTDYDTIPGTPKPTLLKPGAELLRLWAGLTPEFEVNNEGTDLIKGVFNYEVKCSLYRGDVLIGEGVGSCNSLESKYRFRWIYYQDLPENLKGDEHKEARHRLPMKGVITKRGKSTLYRIENENPQDLANTILKMAKKRAFVDGILTVTGASRIFTQDVEDIEDTVKASEVETPAAESSNGTTPEEEPKPEPITSQAEEEPKAKLDFDADWLLDSLKAVKWIKDGPKGDMTIKSYLNNVYKVDTEGTVVEVVARLSREQREGFFKEIQERLSML